MTSAQAAKVLYRLSLPDPAHHMVEVEMHIAGPVGDIVELSMAAWSPGSYLIRDYARYVRHLRAHTRDGRECEITKTSKQNWLVVVPDGHGEGTAPDSPDAGTQGIIVHYRVYGHELTVRTNHIDDTHAFLHGPATYLIPDSLRKHPCRVEITGPEGRAWHIATGLEPDGAGFVAADIDELLDCPIHIGECQVRTFEAVSRPVRLVVWGEPDRGHVADLDTLAGDLGRIIEAHAARFGNEVPYRHYTFLLMLTPGGYGGLEHRNSSANLYHPFVLGSRKEYEGLLELLSHEFFHIWNGKRIAPGALLQPFEYHGEAYTRCLWVMEGLTSYYDRITLLRSGGMSLKRYMEKLAEEWVRYRTTPGRAVQSLEEASYDAWIKLYKPDECNVNTTVSYYLKGGLVALALDVWIRTQTRGERSLDHVLRLLWREYGQKALPYPEEVQPVFERATGLGLHEFFERHVRGRSDPDLEAALAQAGLELRKTWEPSQKVDERAPLWLGVMADGKPVAIKGVLDGSPAARAGLSPGDEIIALDRMRITTEGDLRKRLCSRAPGEPVEVALFRRGRLERVTVELEESPPTRYEIVAVAEPSAEQRAFFHAWLGQEHPGSGTLGAGGSTHIL